MAPTFGRDIMAVYDDRKLCSSDGKLYISSKRLAVSRALITVLLEIGMLATIIVAGKSLECSEGVATVAQL